MVKLSLLYSNSNCNYSCSFQFGSILNPNVQFLNLCLTILIFINSIPHISAQRKVLQNVNLYNYEVGQSENASAGISALELQSQLESAKSGNASWETLLEKNVLLSEIELEMRTASLRGLRIEESSKEVEFDKMVTIILADREATIRLFGDRFTEHTIIRFTTEVGQRGMDCDDLRSTRSFTMIQSGFIGYSAAAKIHLPPLNKEEEFFYVCLRENNTDMPWVHQGTEKLLALKTYESLLPLWSQIVLIIILLLLSGLFSGLNLGLMSLDRTEMKIIAATGTDNERRYAKTIQPLRDNGNYLLCSLLLGNVMVNSTLTILLDGISSGLIAVISATLAIVIFGEIIPQALCSRHGLAVGARTVWLTKFFMALTFPLSYPISVVLDKILGEEIGNVYNRDRLKELIKVTRDYNDLERDEVNIIAGALELKQKTVKDIMTPLDSVFMLPTQAVLDFDTVSEIMVQGYSRIPVYEESRSNIVSLLYTKDLAFVDPDNKMPVRTICEFYHNPFMYVFESTTLDIVFRDFKLGNQGHMALVQRIVVDDKGSDPYYEVIGVVTLEDVIEALIQAEINDETDVWDNPRRRRSRTTLTFSHTVHETTQWRGDGIHISPQLALAAFQYLSTSVDQFNSERISKTILQRLLNQNFFYQIKIKNRDNIKNDPATIVYENGKPADYFVLILEGRVQSEIGKEGLMFESGPFTFFGVQSLNQNAGLGDASSTPTEVRKFGANNAVNLDALLYSTFVPDYTVRAAMDIIYLRISRSVYMAAKQATILERTYSQYDDSGQNQVRDNFEEQIDQMMSSTNIQRSQSDNERNQKYFQDREHPYQTLPNRNATNDIILASNHLIPGYENKTAEYPAIANLKRNEQNSRFIIENKLFPNENGTSSYRVRTESENSAKYSEQDRQENIQSQSLNLKIQPAFMDNQSNDEVDVTDYKL